jgi:hypothetical protein
MFHKVFKSEELNLPARRLDAIHNAVKDFFVDGLELSEKRIEAIEFRHRDGFIPYDHNKGGIEWTSFTDAFTAYLNGTHLKGTQRDLDHWYKVSEEFYREDKGLAQDVELTQEQLEEMAQDYHMGENDTVMLNARFMLHSENEASLFLSVSADDMPYHRKASDVLEFTFKFENVRELRAQLIKVLEADNVDDWLQLTREAWG